MSYKLIPDQSLGRNLHRIFRKQIDGALAVANGQTDPNDTAVHAMRKHLKKARAVLQLARDEIGRDSFRQQDKRLRNVGRLMTEIRDAEVRWQTVRQIEHCIHRRHDRAFRKIEMMLRFELESFLVGFQGWEKQAVLLLQKARDATKKWQIRKYKGKQLRRALRRSYKRGRKALTAVKVNPSSAKFHELRKQVKLLGYQLRIIQPLNRVVVGTVSNELTELGHLLGRIHDLSFLADRLRGEREWRKAFVDLLGTIKRSQAELERDGMEIAERFFAERPRDFALLIENWFEDQESANSSSIAQLLITTHTNGASTRKNCAIVRKIRQADFGPLAFAAS
jgi:CHAD domain-containing protein